MFGEHETPVLGIVENMSTFRCPDCGGEHAIFDEGGGRDLAEETDLPFLGQIPIDPAIRAGGDDGQPVVLDHDEGDETPTAFKEFVDTTADMQGVVRRRKATEGR
jgi:ATP-binding protein involved in chromosome partitioning